MGFMVLDAFVKGDWRFEKKFNALVLKKEDILYVKPQTFMNKSGESISKLVNFYNITLNDLVVIHDDVDLEFGQVKVQQGKSSAGHKGVESIITALGSSDFWRVRVGIGRPEGNIAVEDWVLMPFENGKSEKLVRATLGKLPSLI